VDAHGEASPKLAQKVFHCSVCLAHIHPVNCVVEPEESARTTGTILRSGRVSPGLSARMRGSAHMVILPGEYAGNGLPAEAKVG
jgi:hypothetical protein